MATLKGLRRDIKNVQYDEIETHVRDATCNSNEQPSSDLIAKIGAEMCDRNKYRLAWFMLWKRATDEKIPRHVSKSLTLLDIFLRVNPPSPQVQVWLVQNLKESEPAQYLAKLRRGDGVGALTVVNELVKTLCKFVAEFKEPDLESFLNNPPSTPLANSSPLVNSSPLSPPLNNNPSNYTPYGPSNGSSYSPYGPPTSNNNSAFNPQSPVSRPAATGPQPWVCSMCTFANQPSATQCDVCGFAKAQGASSPSSSSSSQLPHSASGIGLSHSSSSLGSNQSRQSSSQIQIIGSGLQQPSLYSQSSSSLGQSTSSSSLPKSPSFQTPSYSSTSLAFGSPPPSSPNLQKSSSSYQPQPASPYQPQPTSPFQPASPYQQPYQPATSPYQPATSPYQPAASPYQPPLSSSYPQAARWDCPHCRLSNSANDPVCGICSFQRPNSVVPASAMRTWTCTRCRYVNKETAPSCAACWCSKPIDVVYSSPVQLTTNSSPLTPQYPAVPMPNSNPQLVTAFSASASSRKALGPLPVGWEERIDPRNNKSYFINHSQHITTWNDPRVGKETAPPAYEDPPQPPSQPQRTEQKQSAWSEPPQSTLNTEQKQQGAGMKRSWACSLCTAHNEAESMKCSICESPRLGTEECPEDHKPPPPPPPQPAPQPASKQPVKSASVEPWACGVCSYANTLPKYQERCEMCDTVRPAQAVAAAVAKSKEDSWECDWCCTVNAQHVAYCELCFSPKPSPLQLNSSSGTTGNPEKGLQRSATRWQCSRCCHPSEYVECRICGQPEPPIVAVEVKPHKPVVVAAATTYSGGSWQCAFCDVINNAKKEECRICSRARAVAAVVEAPPVEVAPEPLQLVDPFADLEVIENPSKDHSGINATPVAQTLSPFPSSFDPLQVGPPSNPPPSHLLAKVLHESKFAPIPAVSSPTATAAVIDPFKSPSSPQARGSDFRASEAGPPGVEDVEQAAKVRAEIYATEQTYVFNLTRLLAVFIRPINQKSKSFGLSQAQTVALCGNISVIARLHTVLVQDMQKEDIIEVLLKNADFLKIYTSYVNNYESMIATLTLLGKNRNFDKFLAETESESMTLPSYLILPVQRIPRYCLLLRELQKCTAEDAPNYPRLCLALEKLKAIAECINEQKRKFENTSLLLDIQTRIRSPAHYLVCKPGRIFLRQGKLKRLEDDIFYHFFLFNDALLQTTDRYKVVIEMNVNTLTLLPRGADTLAFTFHQMQHKGKLVEYSLLTEIAADREAWTTALQHAISSNPAINMGAAEPEVKHEEQGVILMEGLLQKKSPKGVNRYQERYFELSSSWLSYRKKKGAEKAGEIAVKDIIAIRNTDKKPGEFEIDVRSAGETAIRRFGNWRTFTLLANSVAEAQRWQREIQAQVDAHPPTAAPSIEAERNRVEPAEDAPVLQSFGASLPALRVVGVIRSGWMTVKGSKPNSKANPKRYVVFTEGQLAIYDTLEDVKQGEYKAQLFPLSLEPPLVVSLPQDNAWALEWASHKLEFELCEERDEQPNLASEASFEPDLSRRRELWQLAARKAVPSTLFAVPIDLAVQRSGANTGVPSPIMVALTWLDAHGLEEQGLYRIPGSKMQVEGLIARFDRGEHVEIPVQYSGSNLASLVVQYLRRLPENLFTNEFAPIFQRAMGSEQQLSMLKLLLSKLPQANFCTIRALALHLARVAQRSDVNEMTAQNLSICVYTSMAQVMNALILNCDYLFDQEVAVEDDPFA